LRYVCDNTDLVVVAELKGKWSQQGDAIPLTKLISTFPEFQGIDDEFSKIAGTNVLREGKYVRQEIQLIDCEMGKMLIALQGDENNPLSMYISC